MLHNATDLALPGKKTCKFYYLATYNLVRTDPICIVGNHEYAILTHFRSPTVHSPFEILNKLIVSNNDFKK